MTLYAELLALSHGLVGHGERREDQYPPVRLAADVLRPYELHRRLTESAVGEDGGPPLHQRPIRQVLLKVEQAGVHPDRLKTVVAAELGFLCQELRIGGSHLNSLRVNVID